MRVGGRERTDCTDALCEEDATTGLPLWSNDDQHLRSEAAIADTIDVGGELTVNRMGFGAVRITGSGICGEPPDLDKAKGVLRRAFDPGVNFIDTADSYGSEVSERLIAQALAPYPEDLVIVTKGGLERTGPNQWPINGPVKPLVRCDLVA